MTTAPPSYSTAITKLCASASRYSQSLKRRSILQMIDQERCRRLNIERMRQSRMDNILKSKSSSRRDLNHNQSVLQDQLLALKWRNTLVKDMCQKAIEQSRLEEYQRKRKTAESVRLEIS